MFNNGENARSVVVICSSDVQHLQIFTDQSKSPFITLILKSSELKLYRNASVHISWHFQDFVFIAKEQQQSKRCKSMSKDQL